MLAAHSPLLTDLCSLCNKQVPKYRCPACGTRTCSLPCVTKHKERAVCDGKRDPTKFVKRSKLETPAGIDHDFNFLSGLERRIGDAEKLLPGREQKSWKLGGSKYRDRVQQTGVIIKKAPEVLARHKTNRTVFSQREKAIHWTVEWDLENGKTRRQRAPDYWPVINCYTHLREESTGSRTKRKRGRAASRGTARGNPVARTGADEESAVQTKHEVLAEAGLKSSSAAEHEAGPVRLDVVVKDGPEMSGAGSDVDAESKIKVDPSEHSDDDDDDDEHVGKDVKIKFELANNHDDHASDAEVVESKIKAKPPQHEDGPVETPTPLEKNDPDERRQDKEQQATTEDHPPENLGVHFYLLKPETPAHLPKVLVPLDPHSRLMDCLRGQVVLEYPTILVRSQPPSDLLPDAYITEHDYYARLKRETDGVDVAPNLGLDERPNLRGPDGGASGDFDHAKIVDVLQKDIKCSASL